MAAAAVATALTEALVVVVAAISAIPVAAAAAHPLDRLVAVAAQAIHLTEAAVVVDGALMDPVTCDVQRIGGIPSMIDALLLNLVRPYDVLGCTRHYIDQ